MVANVTTLTYFLAFVVSCKFLGLVSTLLTSSNEDFNTYRERGFAGSGRGTSVSNS